MERIIITPLFGMGDSLMTTPAIELLKKHKPDTYITFFTFNKSNYEILKNNPHIDHLWYYPIKMSRFIQGIYHILRHLSFRYTTSINFYPSNRISYNIFSLLTASRNRIGHSYLNLNFSQMNWLKSYTVEEDQTLHCVEENVQLLRFFDISVPENGIPPTRIYLTPEEDIAGKTFREKIGAKQMVGIHTGTSTFKGHANRRWPQKRFVELINLFPDSHFMLFGAFDEVKINHEIRSATDRPEQVTVVEKKSIREVASIVKYLDGFISNDSGLMHIAAAVGTPIVTILGPTNPVFIHPWEVKHEIVRNELPCSPCFYYSPRPLTCSQKHQFKCLVELETSSVADAVRRCLAVH